jgi:hypothetical protein
MQPKRVDSLSFSKETTRPTSRRATMRHPQAAGIGTEPKV